ncbi:putative mediator of RNA polymerase II transcription subunit 26b [Dendrobium catenatum]|uniref:Putative mediator of RNA polymerase II transcription subunit 26b n=1 Tax=Dendrobium catenatum TaxID=906689 RepID=A0A2I0X5X9_9ASPA|nr:putative mediator of RNA polymerase II transcription subunit 26b [Dendrobium catenatum]
MVAEGRQSSSPDDRNTSNLRFTRFPYDSNHGGSKEKLKATEIGRPVNALRKHNTKHIQKLAQSLVNGWKELVDESVKSTAANNHLERQIIGEATEIGRPVNALRKRNSKHIQKLAQSLVNGWKEFVDEWVKSDAANQAVDDVRSLYQPATIQVNLHIHPPTTPRDRRVPSIGARVIACPVRTNSRNGVHDTRDRRHIRASSSALESESLAEYSASIAPLQLESPVGQFLFEILFSYPHLVPASIDQQLHLLQPACDEDKNNNEILFWHRASSAQKNC